MPCTRVQEIDLAEFAVDPRAAAWAEFRAHYPRCPDCSREVARFAKLTDALEGEGVEVTGHPSETRLLALAERSPAIAADERARLETHVAGCARCRTELAVAQSFDFAAVAAARARPGFLERLGEALAAGLRRPALVAAVIALLAIPAAVLVARRAQQTPALPSPPTAEAERGAPGSTVAERLPRAEPEAARPGAPASATPPEITHPTEPTAIAKAPSKAVAPETNAPELVQIAALLPTESPLYAPGSLARGASVRIASAARGFGAGAPAPDALAPAHVGVTTRESPNLYWFLASATSLPVEVTVVDPGAADPLLEATLPGPLEAGVHRVSLAEHGARLKPGVDYRWFVALVPDPERRSQDVVSGGGIRYAPPDLDPELEARLAAAPPARIAHVYAESGLWYDAFDQLSSWLATEPGAATRLHEHRAALLEQVGLDEAAAFERQSAAGGR